MMQAAMEAAMAEAAARDSSSNNLREVDQHHHQQQQQYAQQIQEEEEESQPGLMDVSSSYSMDAEQLMFLQALQQAEAGDQADILQEMMRLNQSDASMESLLQILAQQQEAENARPSEHYLTIAQNGNYMCTGALICEVRRCGN